jgi:hypothetical protein
VSGVRRTVFGVRSPGFWQVAPVRPRRGLSVRETADCCCRLPTGSPRRSPRAARRRSNRQSQIANPRFQMASPRSQITDPKSQIADSKWEVPNRRSQIPDPRFQMASPRSQITDSKSQMANRKFQIPSPRAVGRGEPISERRRRPAGIRPLSACTRGRSEATRPVSRRDRPTAQ